MATVTTPSTQAKTEWGKIFNRTFNDNCTNSATFMKQLTTIAISTITYLKSVFSDESFMCETFAGLKLNILKDKCKDENAHFVSTTLQQVFEAFEKKYLHRLALCFYGGDSEAVKLDEYYVFEYTYTDDAVSMTVQSESLDTTGCSRYSFENIRDQTVRLLKACVVLIQTHKLTSDADITFRLYYNENAPVGYQAPGFNPCSEPADPLAAASGTLVGSVCTRFHHLQLRSHQLSFQESNEAIPSENLPAISQMEDDFNESECELSPDTNIIRCPCNNKGGTATDVPLLICMYCGRKQHAACFGILGTRARHCCDRCATPTRTPTDPYLNYLDIVKRQSLCIYRGALWWFSRGAGTGGASCAGATVDRLQLAAALGLTQHCASKLMEVLQYQGVLQGDLASSNKIIPEKLKVEYKKYFQTDQATIVDRLTAEYFVTEPDPIREVLNPIEMISLQTTSSVSREINPANVDPFESNESRLNLYKQVMLSCDGKEEELPLSGSHNPVEDVRKPGKKLNKRKSNSVTESKTVTKSGVVKSKRIKMNLKKNKKN